MSTAQIPIESLYGLVRDAHTVDRSGGSLISLRGTNALVLIALSEFLVAAAAALVYDIVICMDQEVSVM